MSSDFTNQRLGAFEILDRLGAAGYRQYEISNVALPGRRSRHNFKYWSDGAWVGFGCGAHSTRDGRRWHNVSEIGRSALQLLVSHRAARMTRR